MAKGDANRVQRQLDFQGNKAQSVLDDTRANLGPQNQQLQNRFNVAADRGEKDYGNIQSGYQSLLGMFNDPSNYSSMSGYQNFAGGGRDIDPSYYKEFAETGGYRPGDIDNMRARAQGSIRSAYAGSQRELDRAKALAGPGGLNNYAASKAKLTRDVSQGLSDSNVNLEATLADQIRQGKLAGAGGLLNIGQADNSSRLAGLGGMNNIDSQRMAGNLSAMSGMNSAYGTAPGMANMYGNQLGQSNSQQLQMSELQNAIASMLIQAQLGRSRVPGDYQQAMGNIGSGLGLAGQFGGILSGLGGFGGNRNSILMNSQG